MPRALALTAGGHGAGVEQVAFWRTQLGLLRNQYFQCRLRGLGLTTLQQGAGMADADIGIVAIQPGKAGGIQWCGVGGLVVGQQCIGQAQAILHRGRQIESLACFTQFAARIQRFAHFAQRTSGASVVAHFRDENHGGVDDAAEQRKHEKNEQPIHLAPGAQGVDGEDHRDDDVQAEAENVHAISRVAQSTMPSRAAMVCTSLSPRPERLHSTMPSFGSSRASLMACASA